jgi:RNA 3'-terminal phosphate cyclase
MVGVAGFEPTTLCSQSRCATRLRHTPIRRGLYPKGGGTEAISRNPSNQLLFRLSEAGTSRGANLWKVREGSFDRMHGLSRTDHEARLATLTAPQERKRQ